MSEQMIIIEPCAGLGNRLLGLGSAYAVAEKLNRRLVVMWKREDLLMLLMPMMLND